MKKLINSVDAILDESLSGFCAAHADIVARGDAPAQMVADWEALEMELVFAGGVLTLTAREFTCDRDPVTLTGYPRP